MIWSNLALHWANDPPRVFAEFRRVLKVGGLLTFTTLGPDTLKELRAAFAYADGYTHTNRFIDMHDLGDMLVAAGFADPVMDMEHLTMTYAEPRPLLAELKAVGWIGLQGTFARACRDATIPPIDAGRHPSTALRRPRLLRGLAVEPVASGADALADIRSARGRQPDACVGFCRGGRVDGVAVL